MVEKKGILMRDKPYFMENPDWYYFDENEWCYKLTDAAPPDAVDSYREFYDNTEEIDGVEIVHKY